ncbi:nuclear transport factor 2 family protein [Mycobacterium neumannii]|uniref:nuclear transport factor 2 family protein n=1 Tax=Mycobacterium neumannii TaxID=2048551 RepID=UPI003AB158B3
MSMQESDGTAISRDELPWAVATYLTAHRDVTTALTAFTVDATATDEGHTYRGHGEIADWVRNAASGYTYSTELVSATRSGDGHFDVLQHLEGDFPGGVADLHFRFTLDGEFITRLVIEP